MATRPAPETFATKLYERLKRDIVQCVFKPGEVLHEGELAAKYKVSKTPVRDALNRLQHGGYVKAEPRRGYTVSPITLKDVQDVYQLRLMVEPPAAAIAAERIEEEQLRKLKELAAIKYKFEDPTSYRAFLSANGKFHTEVARASGNERIAELVQRLLEEMERIFHLGLTIKDSSEEMMREHEDLVQTLVAGDSEKAQTLMSEQIMTSRRRVIEALINDSNIVTTLIEVG